MAPSTWVVLALAAAHVAAVPWARAWLQRRQASPAVLGGVVLGIVAAFGAAVLVYALTPWDLEHESWVLWLFIAGAASLMGYWGAGRRAGHMPSLELTLAAVLVLEFMTAVVLLSPVPFDLSSAPVRSLLIGPAPLGLCLYFGASMGLLVGSKEADPHLGYESLIGRRFLLSKSSSVLSVVTTISVVGVGLGVWLVLVSLGILSGFETDLQNKIIGVNAHLLVQHERGDTFSLAPNTIESIEASRDVVAASAVIESEVAVASQSNFAGALLFGIDPMRSPRVLEVLADLPPKILQALQGAHDEHAGEHLQDDLFDDEAFDDGEGDFAAPAAVPNIIIGIELAKSLNVKAGDTIRVISPILEVLTPLGPAPRSLGFKVVGVFSSKMYEFDARYVFMSLPAARQFLQLADSAVTGVQVKVNDPDRSDRVGSRVLAALNPSESGASPLRVLDWKERNQTLFSALKLERVVAFMVLVFIIFVASFAIVNTLSMSVIEKRKEIAILKTMGARDLGIMKIFLVQGMLVGGFGTVLGVCAAILTVLGLKVFGFAIPGDVYYIDSLPVNMAVWDVLLVVLAAGLIVWNFAVFPALRGAALKPVEGLRDG